VKRLIRLAQSGDKLAKEELLARLRAKLSSMARFYARCSNEDYDDLLGEAWLAALEALEITDVNIGQPEQYLLKRARWRILDYIKWAKRRRAAEPLESEDIVTTDDVAPEAIDTAIVAQVGGRLSDTQKTVLRHLLQGHTWREIAQVMGCSSANVAYHVRQIRTQYRGLLDHAPA